MALEVNLSATLHVTRAVLPSMIARRHGAFLMVISGQALECPGSS